jgi:hypothetical protein
MGQFPVMKVRLVFLILIRKVRPSNYRDLFPVPPAPGEANSCTTEGVLGVLPGIIGLMQANEVIKILAGVGIPLVNKLFTIDISDYRTLEMEVSPGVHSGMPGSVEEFMRFDYDSFCSANAAADDGDCCFHVERMDAQRRMEYHRCA